MKSTKIEAAQNTQFPLSKTKKIIGNRRLVREKIMQMLVAHLVSGVEIQPLFEHIFYRDFNVDDTDTTYTSSTASTGATTTDTMPLLTDEEIINMNSDAKIEWQPDTIVFGQELIKSILENYDFIASAITEVSENWNFERISIVDRAIICIAAAEFISFPDIPLKATINEAVELAKLYSSDKSYIFINGIVEKLKIIFTEKNLINKSERGKK